MASIEVRDAKTGQSILVHLNKNAIKVFNSLGNASEILSDFHLRNQSGLFNWYEIRQTDSSVQWVVHNY
jgi:hypothetical protein